jgi:hypothetical protein
MQLRMQQGQKASATARMRMLSNSLAPAKASNAKGKSIFEVDNVQNAMETLTEHIEGSLGES